MLERIVSFGTAVWDFIDKRDIDKHATAWSVFVGTGKLLFWTVHFASSSPRAGMEIAAIIAAVWAPWNIVLAAVVNWYFSTKTGVQ